MEIKYATEWLEGKLAPDAAAYQGRVLGLEMVKDLEKTLRPTLSEYKSMLIEMKVLPYNNVSMRSAFGNVELKLEADKNEFKDYTQRECCVNQYRSVITIRAEEKTLEQLAGILDKYKDKIVK